MNPGKAAAMTAAAQHDCLLEVAYHRVNGFDLLLWAPEGLQFRGLGTTYTAHLAGQGCLRDEMDWGKTVESIEHEVARGFEEDEDGEGNP